MATQSCKGAVQFNGKRYEREQLQSSSLSTAIPISSQGFKAYRLAHRLMHNLSSIYFCSQNARIVRPRIPCCPQDPCFRKSRCAKFLKEGAAFLRPGNSGKPIARIISDLRRERFPQYQFSCADHAILSHDSCQFSKDCFTLEI